MTCLKGSSDRTPSGLRESGEMDGVASPSLLLLRTCILLAISAGVSARAFFGRFGSAETFAFVADGGCGETLAFVADKGRDGIAAFDGVTVCLSALPTDPFVIEASTGPLDGNVSGCNLLEPSLLVMGSFGA